MGIFDSKSKSSNSTSTDTVTNTNQNNLAPVFNDTHTGNMGKNSRIEDNRVYHMSDQGSIAASFDLAQKTIESSALQSQGFAESLSMGVQNAVDKSLAFASNSGSMGQTKTIQYSLIAIAVVAGLVALRK